MAGATLKGADRLKASLKKLAGEPGKVRAGVLEGATNYETGEPIAPYAAANEYGAPGIPSRPYMRATVARERETWIRGLGNAIRNGRGTRASLQLVGQRMAEDIQATINSNMAPPNSPETIRAKTKKVTGGAKGETMAPGTLIDTGSMLQSIESELEA